VSGGHTALILEHVEGDHCSDEVIGISRRMATAEMYSLFAVRNTALVDQVQSVVVASAPESRLLAISREDELRIAVYGSHDELRAERNAVVWIGKDNDQHRIGQGTAQRASRPRSPGWLTCIALQPVHS
jgi:hypothetical protein